MAAAANLTLRDELFYSYFGSRSNHIIRFFRSDTARSIIYRELRRNLPFPILAGNPAGIFFIKIF